MTLTMLVKSLLVLTWPSGILGPDSYECVVTEQLHLQDGGTLERPPIPSLLGKAFTVNRNTGAVTGEGASGWFFADHETSVLTRGNEHSSFVVTNVAPAREGGIHHTILSIREFQRARLKPFVLLDGLQVLSGLCA